MAGHFQPFVRQLNWDIFDDTGNISSHVYGDKTGYFWRDCVKFLAMFVAMESDISDETWGPFQMCLCPKTIHCNPNHDKPNQTISSVLSQQKMENAAKRNIKLHHKEM